MKRILTILFFLSIGCAGLLAQSKGQFLKAADEAMAKSNYYAALNYYNIALEFDEKDPKTLFKSAEAARNFDAYKLAISKYTNLIDTLNYTEEPLALFHLATMHQRVGDYEKAKQYYNLYLSQYSKEGDYHTDKAKVELAASEWAQGKITEKDSTVTIERLNTDVNSTESDFAPTIQNEALIYSSMRFKEAKPTVHPSRQTSKILKFRNGSSEVLDKDLNESDLSLANTAIATDGKTVYFTKCKYVSENQLRCELYRGVFENDSIIKDVIKLDNNINDTAFTTTQPSIGKFEGQENEVLFFASDRAGGKGKMDIWYAIIDSKTGPTKPINLSSINTNEDDITPFFHIPSNTLYFSSNGKQGFGGHDVYAAEYDADSIINTVHLDAPVNTSYHDIYYILSDDHKKAFLSSNREGSLFVDSYLQSCCFDIYEADITPLTINLKALTFNSRTGQDLSGATVTLIDQSTGKVVAISTNDLGNLHNFPLERGKTYLLIASKPNFKSDSTIFNTNSIKTSQDITKKLYLEPDNILLDVFTWDDITKDSLLGATIVLEDLSNPDNPKIFRVNELGNDFHFELERGKTYRIKATKDGYSTASELIDTRGLETVIRKDLYLKRLNLAAYVGLELYFDNDQPEPNSKSTATNKRYDELFKNYLKRKSIFEKSYTKGETGENKSRSMNTLNDFFENDVIGGYSKFNKFMTDLLEELKSGQHIELNIKGYASPRFDLKYNLVLGQRRVNSVRNEMLAFQNGVFKPYFKNHQLILNQISYGEELAPADVSDNLQDQKGSIYSVKASKQRKVELISVKAKL